MRRLVLALLLLSGFVLAPQPAGAQEVPDVGSLANPFDPDGEPCTAIPNQIPGIFDFSSACVGHDACYVFAGDNRTCDLAFRNDMLALCAAQHPDVFDPARYLCQTVAFIYYTGVVIFGLIT